MMSAYYLHFCFSRLIISWIAGFPGGPYISVINPHFEYAGYAGCLLEDSSGAIIVGYIIFCLAV